MSRSAFAIFGPASVSRALRNTPPTYLWTSWASLKYAIRTSDLWGDALMGATRGFAVNGTSEGLERAIPRSGECALPSCSPAPASGRLAGRGEARRTGSLGREHALD